MLKMIALALAVPLLVVGCASSPQPGGPGLGGDPFAEQTGTTAEQEDNGAGVPAGDVDCAAISQQQAQTFSYGIQTLAKLNSQGTVDAINGGSIGFSTESFADALAALHALDGHAVDPYGDPAEALDYYETVNSAAANLLAYDTPVPEGEFSSYTSTTGGSSQIINEQASIGASYNAFCRN